MNSINNIQTRRQAGASLFEALIFIVVSALVITGVIGLAVKVFSSNSETQVVTQATEFNTSLKNLYAGQSGYGASTNFAASLNATNLIPSGITFTAPSTMTGNYGAVTAIANATGTDYTLTYSDIPYDSCIKIVGKLTQGWLGVKIGSNTEQTVLPVPVATATTQCGSSGTTTLALRAR